MSAARWLTPLLAVVALAVAAPTAGAVTWTNHETIPLPYQQRPAVCDRDHQDNCSWNKSTVRDIDGVPKGEEITAAFYSLNSPRITDALIAADRRGVKVHVLGWRFSGGDQESKGEDPSGEYLRLAKALGKSKHSWAKTCTGGCRRSGTTGIHHDKSITFSRTRNDVGVVRHSSGNWTWATERDGSNGGVRIVSKVIERAWAKCHDTSRADKMLPDCANVTDGPVSTNFLPRKDARDFVLSELKATRGYPGGHVTLATYKITTNRLAVVDELIRHARQGSLVELGTNDRYGSNAKAWTKKVREAQKAGVRVYNANRFPEGAKGPNYYEHNKRLTLRAKKGGKVYYSDVVGSATESYSAFSNNDEVQVRFTTEAATREGFDIFATKRLGYKGRPAAYEKMRSM